MLLPGQGCDVDSTSELGSNLSGETRPDGTPRCSADWEGPIAPWYCHCCNRLNEETARKCRTCGRPSAYGADLHLPLFGSSAASMRPEQGVFLLNERGFDANTTDAENWTPAHMACIYGNVGLLEVLIKSGALFEAQTKRGWRPLHFASRGGHLECVDLLLSNSAKVSCPTKGCLSTPLHVASAAGFDDVCGRLLRQGADIGAQDVAGRTSLHLAADNGHLQVVRVLIEGSAKADVLDHDKWIPRQVAEFRGHMEIAKLLTKVSPPKDEGVATRGASTALPPAPWHMKIFAQVRKDTARARKLDARSLAREEAYARYANIYKDHAAEKYARSLEASRQGPGGMEAYRKRIVDASTDARRYWGYNPNRQEEEYANEGSDGDDGDGDIGGRLTDGLRRVPRGGDQGERSSKGRSSSGHSGGAGSCSLISSQSRGSGPAGERRVAQSISSSLGRDKEGSSNFYDSVQCSEVNSSIGEQEEDDGGNNGLLSSLLVTREVTARCNVTKTNVVRSTSAAMMSGTKAATNTFVDVVPFHNIRAKFLRPWSDTALSRPYHVSTSPDRKATPTGTRTPTTLLKYAATSLPVVTNAGIGVGFGTAPAMAVPSLSRSASVPPTRWPPAGSKVLTRTGAKAWGGV